MSTPFALLGALSGAPRQRSCCLRPPPPQQWRAFTQLRLDLYSHTPVKHRSFRSTKNQSFPKTFPKQHVSEEKGKVPRCEEHTRCTWAPGPGPAALEAQCGPQPSDRRAPRQCPSSSSRQTSCFFCRYPLLGPKPPHVLHLWRRWVCWVCARAGRRCWTRTARSSIKDSSSWTTTGHPLAS